MHLANSIVWPIPIILDISKKEYDRVKNKQKILLVDKKNIPNSIIGGCRSIYL